MRRTKADRFERMVRKLTSDDQSCGLTEVLLAEEAIQLLRREHRAVVRMVKQLLDKPVKGREITFPGPTKQMRDPSVMRKPIVQIYNMACRDILDRLEARAR